MIGLPATTMPRVASTESRNPKLVDSAGCASTSPITARHRKLKPRPGRPPARATSPIAPITAARRTLASGPTIRTNSPSPARQRTAANARLNRRLRAASSRAPRMRLQLAPLTAVRWVMPTDLHGRVQLRIQGAGVTGDHARQEAPGVTVEVPGGSGETAAELAGPLLPGPGRRERERGGAGREDRRFRLARLGRLEFAGGADPLARGCMFPVGAAHDQQPGLRLHPVRVEGHVDQGGRDRPPVRESGTPRRPEPPGRTRYLHFHGDGGVRGGGRGHGTFVPPGGVDGGVPARCGGEQQGHGHRRVEAPPRRRRRVAVPRRVDTALSSSSPEPATRVRQRAASAAGCRWCPAAAAAHTSTAAGTRRTSVLRRVSSRAGPARPGTANDVSRPRIPRPRPRCRRPCASPAGAFARPSGTCAGVRSLVAPGRPADRRVDVPLPVTRPFHVGPALTPGPGAAGPRAVWVRTRPRHPAPQPAGSRRAACASPQSAAPAPVPPAGGWPVPRRLPCSG